MAESKAERFRVYRKQIAERGGHQVVVNLPKETVAYLDDLKRRQGLRNRSQALVQLIERGRDATR